MASLRKKGRCWYFRVMEADGSRPERKGCSDKRVTQQMAAAREAEVALIKAGILDTKTIAYRQHEAIPASVHAEDFNAYLLAKGNKPRYVSQVRTHVLELLRRAGVDRLSDLKPSRVQEAIAEVRGEGLSLQTCNHWLTHAKAFDKWLWKDGRRPETTLSHLTGFNVKTDRRHDRGVLGTEEWGRLLEAAASGRPFRELTGADRVMLYILATYTGLRASELASIVPKSFDLEKLVVNVAAGYTKNGDEATLPLRPDLAELLRVYLDGRDAESRVWPGTWHEKAASMLRLDLEAAGIAYVDEDKKFRDFHSLRHRFGTNMALANVPPKVMKELMRHSDIRLTLGTYSHVGLHDVAGAVDLLPPDSNRPKQTRGERAGRHGDGRPSHQRTLFPSPSPPRGRPWSSGDAHRHFR